MKMYHLFVWFIGAFVGSALSVWLNFHWLLGVILGALTGIGLTVWRELWDLFKSVCYLVHHSKWTLVGWFREKIEEVKSQELRRKQALAVLLEWIIPCHGGAILLALMAFLFSHNRVILVSEPIIVLSLLCLFIPIFLGVAEYLQEDEIQCRWKDLPVTERRYEKAKKSALKWNVLSFPFTLTFFVSRGILRWLKKTDPFAHWERLFVAIHAGIAIPSGIFCGIGALIGYVFENPFIGGFAGLAIGCVEYLLVRKFVPRAVCRV